MPQVLEFSDVVVRRNARNIVDHLNWTVSDDERWMWEFVRDEGPVSASDSAVMLQTAEEEADMLLAALTRRRLLMRLESEFLVPGTPFNES